jgi:hypothetical protein
MKSFVLYAVMICIYLQSTKVTDQFMKMLLIIHVYIKIYIRMKNKPIRLKIKTNCIRIRY